MPKYLNNHNHHVQGHEVRRLRNKMKLSQQKFAGLLQCSYSSIQAWEGETSNPNGFCAAFMIEIARRINLTPPLQLYKLPEFKIDEEK